MHAPARPRVDSSTISPQQVRAVQAARRAAGLDDEAYRARLARDYGVTSTKDLTSTQAEAFRRALSALPGGREPSAGGAGPITTSGRAARDTVSGPYAPKLRALWIGAYHLGVVASADDRALLEFARRQTGLDHVRWLSDPRDASSVIEALRAMMEREAGVCWPSNRANVDASKRAIAVAQWRRLRGLGAVLGGDDLDGLGVIVEATLGRRGPAPDGAGPLDGLSWGDLDRVSAALGKRLRTALADARRVA